MPGFCPCRKSTPSALEAQGLGIAHPVATPEGAILFVGHVHRVVDLPAQTADADEQGTTVLLRMHARRMDGNKLGEERGRHAPGLAERDHFIHGRTARKQATAGCTSQKEKGAWRLGGRQQEDDGKLGGIGKE